MYYEDILMTKLESLTNISENNKAKLLAEIKHDISDAYSKERINELHYTLLKEKVSNYEEINNSKIVRCLAS